MGNKKLIVLILVVTLLGIVLHLQNLHATNIDVYKGRPGEQLWANKHTTIEELKRICTHTCQNNGTCLTSEMCQCTQQWTGLNCATPVCPPSTTDCDLSCYNGSTCGNCPDYCNCLKHCPHADGFFGNAALPLSYCTSTCNSCDGICYITGTRTGTCGSAYCNCLHSCSESVPLPVCISTCHSCAGICFYTGNAIGTNCDPAYCTCVHSCVSASRGDYFAVDGDFIIDYNNAADISACNATCTISTGK